MQVKHLRNDYRFMPQITSSAAWNNPPPDALVKLLHVTNKASKVCHHTREKMVRLFQASWLCSHACTLAVLVALTYEVPAVAGARSMPAYAAATGLNEPSCS